MVLVIKTQHNVCIPSAPLGPLLTTPQDSAQHWLSDALLRVDSSKRAVHACQLQVI